MKQRKKMRLHKILKVNMDLHKRLQKVYFLRNFYKKQKKLKNNSKNNFLNSLHQKQEKSNLLRQLKLFLATPKSTSVKLEAMVQARELELKKKKEFQNLNEKKMID